MNEYWPELPEHPSIGQTVTFAGYEFTWDGEVWTNKPQRDALKAVDEAWRKQKDEHAAHALWLVTT